MTNDPSRPHLRLTFADSSTVTVSLDAARTPDLPFKNPYSLSDYRDLRWYLEVYSTQSLGDPDDAEAARIASLLPELGRRLFVAVFGHDEAAALFHQFRRNPGLLTIVADHPAILSLPWELLHELGHGGFLFHQHPRISIRRAVTTFRPQPPRTPMRQERLHLLFVVCRPHGASFIDPRADPLAVLDAIESYAPGRITTEFLRPPTLRQLLNRLSDPKLPAVDILHFDGHGCFDRKGTLGQPDTGYLLFEKTTGEADYVSAAGFAKAMLHSKPALVILSACQSATMANDDSDSSMGSVAAHLTASGLPAVLAMAYSVLVATTRAFFGALYQGLAQQKDLGEALDYAREYLATNPERYEAKRGHERTWLCLQDWFLPTLYQGGPDQALLAAQAGDPTPASPPPATNLDPIPPAGFFGRVEELFFIERCFARGGRRITISGLSGQGKTALAQEAGRWLTRTGFFACTVLVDFTRNPAQDATAVAVANVAEVVGRNLSDADAVTDILRQIPVLVILDHLESLSPASCQSLLTDAAAWSEAGASRVLATTCGGIDDPAYVSNRHERLRLTGLGSRDRPESALAWFAAMYKMPPEPTVAPTSHSELVELFSKVDFHPLFIGALATALKTRTATDVAAKVQDLLVTSGRKPAVILQLFLDRLSATECGMIRRLGVFQDGGFESELVLTARMPERYWRPFSRHLEVAGLIECEPVPGWHTPFWRFHPALAGILWQGVPAHERPQLLAAYRHRYGELANALFSNDQADPQKSRLLAKTEMTNLLHAARLAVESQDPGAGAFAHAVVHFLRCLGLVKEATSLAQTAATQLSSQAAAGWIDTQIDHGKAALLAGELQQAITIFSLALDTVGTNPTAARVKLLLYLSDSLERHGEVSRAAEQAEEALAIIANLAAAGSEVAESLQRSGLIALANARVRQGRHEEAARAYETALALAHDFPREQAVIRGQLGSLLLDQGRLKEALENYQHTYQVFHSFGERAEEATTQHQLGIVLTGLREYDEAEVSYREAARIGVELGDPLRAAGSWVQLASLAGMAGNPGAAEAWHLKALAVFKAHGHKGREASTLQNLAALLIHKMQRPREGRELAEQAIEIRLALDPSAAQVGPIYDLLAAATQQLAAAATDERIRLTLASEARGFRRSARDAQRTHPAAANALQPFATLINSTALLAVADPQQARRILSVKFDNDRTATLIAALLRIVDGERDTDLLCEYLDSVYALVVEEILKVLPSQ